MKDNWVIDREGRSPCVRISTIKQWYVFPWGHFFYAEGDFSGNQEEVIAEFSTHRVIFRGEGLRQLMDALQYHSLLQVETSLRTDKFERPGGQPLILEIEVQELKREE